MISIFPFAAELQVIRKQLKKCYKESGVNFQQNCRELAQVRQLSWRALVGDQQQPSSPAISSAYRCCRLW